MSDSLLSRPKHHSFQSHQAATLSFWDWISGARLHGCLPALTGWAFENPICNTWCCKSGAPPTTALIRDSFPWYPALWNSCSGYKIDMAIYIYIIYIYIWQCLFCSCKGYWAWRGTMETFNTPWTPPIMVPHETFNHIYIYIYILCDYQLPVSGFAHSNQLNN